MASAQPRRVPQSGGQVGKSQRADDSSQDQLTLNSRLSFVYRPAEGAGFAAEELASSVGGWGRSEAQPPAGWVEAPLRCDPRPTMPELRVACSGMRRLAQNPLDHRGGPGGGGFAHIFSITGNIHEPTTTRQQPFDGLRHLYGDHDVWRTMRRSTVV
jgi:hypothetical protein